MSNLQINTLTPRTNPQIDIQGLNPPTFQGAPLSTQNWVNSAIAAITSATINSPDPSGLFPGKTTVQSQLAGIAEYLAGAMPFSVTGGGGSPTILDLLKAMYRASNPIGKVVYGYWRTAPTGTLLLNGATYSRANYSGLWNFANSNGFVISSASLNSTNRGFFTDGNGTSTFTVPNISDLFLRARDPSTNSGTATDIGKIQPDMVKAHKHATTAGEASTYGYDYPWGNSTASTYRGINNTMDHDNVSSYTNDGTDLSGEAAGSLNPVGTVGSENRPVNIALAAAIYY